MSRRSISLIVVASTSPALAEDVAGRLRQGGSVVYVTHTSEGCLRVATSTSPDIVLLDPALPHRLEDLLRAHPASSQAQILHMDVARPAARVPALPVTAGPQPASRHS
jgi:DNA-binding response OmpR family regulator